MIATRGRTDRMILLALVDLSSGYSVVIVAHPADEAARIRRRAIGMAKAMGIPCRNVKGADLDAPMILARPFGYEPQRYSDRKTRVYIDHSAQFERGSLREEPVRPVAG